ncbi:hypothetical protein BP5796_01184 [Coleophoma crateriformis]|uniref:Xylanolytic transcriptional activator regulatory domain-containing protein n=1 Tax=Coleophoma crateriformis TaxID=565419 RepID=A0A3D8SZT0_9HELO|nr:hypothetical protein BP5796_01184 [Coleophoma crateriformis]
MGADEQALLEQVRANLDLPPSKFVFSTPSQPNPPSWQGTDARLQDDQMPAALQPQADLTAMQTQRGSVMEFPCESDQDAGLDLTNWTDPSAPQIWDDSPSDWPWQVLNDFAVFPTFTEGEPSPAVELGDSAQNDGFGSSGASDDEGEEGIIPSLAARFGSLRRAQDGRLRYYGSASNRHFLKNFGPHENQVDFCDAQEAAAATLENAQLDQEVPPSLETHLVELFFTWHNPCHSTVDRSMFEAARAHDNDGQSDFCSQSLVATICAIGAAFEGRYHQSFITFPKPLADFFAERSRLLLELELDSPCVATVQALLLLSSHEAACGRETRMWLYSGMAMRLAFDLGLHVDSDAYVKQGLLTVMEKEARQSTFWSCVVINHLWSFSLGRPFRIDGEEITVARPGVGSQAVSGTWTAYTNASSGADALVDEERQMCGNTSSLVTAQWVSLCVELAPLFRVLYGCVKISKAALQSLSFQTTTRLLSWKEGIPDALRIRQDQVPLPHTILLHMAYHNFCILAHRPWTSKSSQPKSKIGPGHEHARSVCHSSASEIASLLHLYESYYGFRRMTVYVINIITSASLILIFGLIAEEVSSRPRDKSEKLNVASDLNTCFRALDELGQSFECARRHHEHLVAIQKHWSQRKKDAKAGVKRKSQRQGATSQASQRASKQSRFS